MANRELVKEWLHYIRGVCIDGNVAAYDDDWEHLLNQYPEHPIVQVAKVLIRHGYKPPWEGPDA